MPAAMSCSRSSGGVSIRIRVPAAAFDHGADARPLVARIGRPADLAVAAELRHAEARAGAEEGQLHRRARSVSAAHGRHTVSP